MGQYVAKLDRIIDSPIMNNISRATNTISRESQWRIYRMSLILCDILLTALAFRVAYWIRFEQFVGLFQIEGQDDISYYRLLSLGLILAWFIMNAFHGIDSAGGRDFALFCR